MDAGDRSSTVTHESAETAALLGGDGQRTIPPGCAYHRRNSLDWTPLTKTSTSVSSCTDAAGKQQMLGVTRQNVRQSR